MRVLHSRGSNFLVFTFPSKQSYTTKIKSFLRYSKYTINSLVYQRKRKVKSVFIQFYFRNRDEDTGNITYHYYGRQASWFIPPPPITRRNLLPFTVNELETIIADYRERGSTGIEIHKIIYHFIYE